MKSLILRFTSVWLKPTVGQYCYMDKYMDTEAICITQKVNLQENVNTLNTLCSNKYHLLQLIQGKSMANVVLAIGREEHR